MWTFGRNTLIGVMGLSVAALAAPQATAGDYGKGRHRSGAVKVVTVKKVVHVPARPRWHRPHRRVVHYVPRTVIVHRHAPVRVVHHDHYYDDDYGYYGNGYSSGYSDRTLAGGVIGAAVGALAGNSIGKGSGRVAAIVGGAVIGAIVGGSIGQSMDRIDVIQTSGVLETAKTGQTVAWRNPDSGSEYSVTPVRTYQMETGRYCREFTTRGWIGGKEETLYGTACRMEDGSWRQTG
jgi:surface antigen